jgi:tellurite methyltransferase
MTDASAADPPSPFVVEWASMLRSRVPTPRRALDVAMGRGRHAALLARLGFNVFGVDSRYDAVRHAARVVRAGGSPLRAWCADLSEHPIPKARFELVVVTRFLIRELWHALAEGLVPGGAIVYETFTTRQRLHGRGPTSPDHLLEPGELRAAFPSLDVVFYEEMLAPDAYARLVAIRPDASTSS